MSSNQGIVFPLARAYLIAQSTPAFSYYLNPSLELIFIKKKIIIKKEEEGKANVYLSFNAVL